MKKLMFYKPYTGYVRETLTYLTFPFHRKSEPTKKFVIFTVGRSGSSLLVSLLHSHEQIHCDDELYKRKLFSPRKYLHQKALLSSKDVYGFKLNTYHFRDQEITDPKEFLNEIHQAGYQIISLRRRDIVRQSISHMYALHRDKFHHSATQGELTYDKFVIDLDFLQEELEKFEDFRSLHTQLIADFPHLAVYYEDDLLDSSQHQNTIDKIVEFLGVPPAKVSTKFTKTTPKKLSDFISNYDAVEHFLKNSKYASDLKLD
jgi:LPS sulfotransferase NodH